MFLIWPSCRNVIAPFEFQPLIAITFPYREQHTLALLSKFKNKLEKVKEKEEVGDGESSKRIRAVNDNNDDDIAGGE